MMWGNTDACCILEFSVQYFQFYCNFKNYNFLIRAWFFDQGGGNNKNVKNIK